MLLGCWVMRVVAAEVVLVCQCQKQDEAKGPHSPPRGPPSSACTPLVHSAGCGVAPFSSSLSLF